jgi:cell division protease FtsH
MEHDFRFRQYREFLEQANRIFPTEPRIFTLDFDMLQRIWRRLRVVKLHGVSDCPPIRGFSGDNAVKGHYVSYGILEYELPLEGRTFHLLRWRNTFEVDYDSPLGDLWMIPAEEQAAFYHRLRKLSRPPRETHAPVMPEGDRQRLWNNTIGFLDKGRAALERFGVPLRRGVLLMGTPGNGKTMACRWLQSEVLRQGYIWRSVTPDLYMNYRSRGQTSQLFDLEHPGIILFDDLDHALKNREEYGGGLEQTSFLSELDGIRIRQGVVFLFTTNAGIDDLDAAFRRPGRIDHMIRFSPPGAALRREFISERWPEELRAAIPLDRAVEQTEGLSFAELEEIKKQMVLGYLESNRWDWDESLALFRLRIEEEQPRKPIGFVCQK